MRCYAFALEGGMFQEEALLLVLSNCQKTFHEQFQNARVVG